MDLTKEIKVYDNFLDTNNFLKIQEILLGEEFPWYCGSIIKQDNNTKTSIEEKYNFQFYHTFFINPYYQSPAIDIIKPLLQKLEPMFLIRVKANLNPATNIHIEHGMHNDIEANISDQSYTAVFYLNTNNGYTLFEAGEKVESLANRLVVFPRSLKHTGSTCTDVKRRAVLNLNFIKVE